MKITPEMTRKVDRQILSPKPETGKHLPAGKPSADQVMVVTEPTDDEVVAASMRNAAGEALPKQARTASSVPIKSLLNPLPSSAPMQISQAPAPQIVKRPRRQKSKGKKKTKTRTAGIPDHVGKYDVLTELARAPSGLTFGQLIRGDAETAKIEIRKVLSKTARAGNSITAQVADGAHRRRLKVVSLKVYGTFAQALLDSGVV